METKSILPDLNVGDIFKCAWAYTKKHFLPVLLIVFLTYMVTSLPNSYLNLSYLSAFMSSEAFLTEEQWAENLLNENPIFFIKLLLGTIIASIIASFIRVYLDLVRYRVLVSAIETDNVDLTAALKGGFRGYWFYWVSLLLLGICVIFWTLFCVLPGIFFAIRLIFVPILAANKPELTISEVFARSWKMTEGNFFELLLLGIVAMLILVAGVFVCCVGVIPAIIIVNFMFAEAYHRLLGEGDNEKPVNDNSQQPAYVKDVTDGYVRE